MIGVGNPAIIYLLLIFLIISCIIWLVISIIKKYTVGKIVSTILILLFAFPFMDDFYRSYERKNNVIKDLQTLNLRLNDKFSIIENYESYIFGGNLQHFSIEISDKDQEKIINQIVNSKNFQEKKNENYVFLDNDYNDNREYLINYKYPQYYTRKIKTKIDGKMLAIDLEIGLKDHVLKYSKWEK
ncbi:hypothetical protein SAMN05660477_01061 [Soonwooa buanensis]|uniref:Uncharacterized protein n=2 Tax=Soonwooa buanensis TaxID=619805 RepID=A0A1T5DVY7_9FLAO|nr:hypothetical protein SAMN05660477_01061 [Soonwooa buanensis]